MCEFSCTILFVSKTDMGSKQRTRFVFFAVSKILAEENTRGRLANSDSQNLGKFRNISRSRLWGNLSLDSICGKPVVDKTGNVDVAMGNVGSVSREISVGKRWQGR